MAWSDYFEPEFGDTDSPSYVKVSPYLPINPTLLDCTIELSSILWDIRNPTEVVRQMGKYERLREYAVKINNSDTLWERFKY